MNLNLKNNTKDEILKAIAATHPQITKLSL
jgi:hypothetical protein